MPVRSETKGTVGGEMTPKEQWDREGYVFVKQIYEPERVARLLAICNQTLEQWRICNPENGKPGGDENTNCMRHLNHPGYFRDNPVHRPVLLDAIADPSVIGLTRELFGEEPLFRCTSFFFNPSASSQDGNWHRDSQFGTPDDAAEKAVLQDRGVNGSSVQMQIALEASDDVEVVPGSHLRWDTPEEYAIRKADEQRNSRSNEMPGAIRPLLEPGDAILFNPAGLHRGRYHAGRVRRTFMLTFTKTSSPYYDYFSHQPWCLESGYLEGVKQETRAFFDAFIDIYTEAWKKALSQ